MVNRRELFPIDKVLGAHKILTIKILVIILLFNRVEVLSSRRWIHKRHCRFTLFTRFSLLYISLVTRRHKIPRSSCWGLHPNFSNTNRLCIMWASHGTSLSLRTTKIMVYIISTDIVRISLSINHVWTAGLGTAHASFLRIAHYAWTSIGIIRGISTLFIVTGESSRYFDICDHARVFTNQAALLLLIFLGSISISVSVLRVCIEITWLLFRVKALDSHALIRWEDVIKVLSSIWS